MAPDTNSPDEKPFRIDDDFSWKVRSVSDRISALLKRVSAIEVLLIVSVLGIAVGLLGPAVSTGSRPHQFPPPLENPSSNFAPVAASYAWGHSPCGFVPLQILTDGRYSYSLFSTSESGWVKREGDTLILEPIGPRSSLTDRVFLPVRWGTRRYLISPDAIQDFCTAILTVKEPRSHPFGDFLLAGQEEVTGLPGLPEPWASYLRENIVLGTVLETSPDGRVRLDVGSAEGVHVGDVFASPRDEPHDPWQWMVVFASYDSCELEFIVAKEDKGITIDQTGVHPGRNLVMSRLLLSSELRWQ